MNKARMQATINNLRTAGYNMGEALADADSPWYPLKDSEFWRSLDEIERIGDTEDESGIGYLADLILIQDLEPMGRGMILSFAALTAVTQIPQAAQQEIFTRAISFTPEDTRYRKIGWCLLIEAAGLSDPIAATISPQIDSMIAQMAGDPDLEVHKRATTIQEERQGKIARSPDTWCFFCVKESE